MTNQPTPTNTVEDGQPPEQDAGTEETTATSETSSRENAAPVDGVVEAELSVEDAGADAAVTTEDAQVITSEDGGDSVESVVPAEDGVPAGEFGDEDQLLPAQTAMPVGDEVVVDDDTMRRALEAILMVTDEPLPVLTLARAVGRATVDVATALAALAEEYTEQGRGFDLREVGGGWRYYTRVEAAPYVERFVLDGQQARLTQAALETLAVVAYKQPVSRARVSAIRGVNVDGVMRTLVARGLVEEAGSDTESQATLYRTTTYFLERMGMHSLDDLPELAPYLPEMDDIEEELAAQSLPPAAATEDAGTPPSEGDPTPLPEDLGDAGDAAMSDESGREADDTLDGDPQEADESAAVSAGIDGDLGAGELDVEHEAGELEPGDEVGESGVADELEAPASAGEFEVPAGAGELDNDEPLGAGQLGDDESTQAVELGDAESVAAGESDGESAQAVELADDEPAGADEFGDESAQAVELGDDESAADLGADESAVGVRDRSEASVVEGARDGG